MDTEKMSARNIRALLIMMVMHCSLISATFTVKQDAWIAVVMMTVIYIPLILVYSRICALYPGKGLFEIIGEIFGKVGKTIIVALLLLYAVNSASLTLHGYTDFTSLISLENTPKIPISILLVITAAYLSYKGAKQLGRWSLIVCVFSFCMS